MKLPESFQYESSEIDWCESNYVVSRYIIEFWNTMSSFSMLLLPILLSYLYKDYSKHTPHCRQLNIMWFVFVIVGLGSIYFHATLSLSGQLADEIGMIWMSSSVVTFWWQPRYLPIFFQKNRLIFQLIMLSISISVTLMSLVRPEINHFCFFTLSVPTFFWLKEEMKRNRLPELTQLCKKSGYYIAAAVLCWVSDRFFCSVCLNLNFPYFHAVWHVLITIGVCHGISCFSCIYALDTLPHKQPQLVLWRKGNFPNLIGIWIVRFKITD